jgi:hypothetical protein
MDTGSLAVIVGHWKQVTAAGGTLALAGARYRYTKTLWITGLLTACRYGRWMRRLPRSGRRGAIAASVIMTLGPEPPKS